MSNRPNIRNSFTNFRDYDAPLAQKLRMAARNATRRITTRSNCCGHPGEPGC